MDNDIKVSIICTAFNHEKYIRQCLDGFVMQKTNFKYEVLINDDASTDNTAQIIKEYEKKYPEIIKPVYQTENQYSKGVKISMEILTPKAKGKYIAFCEGDDYWCDENKLQLQVDRLEARPECKMCVHSVRGFRDDSDVENFYPYYEIKEGEIDSEIFINITKDYLFQTSSYLLDAETYKTYIKKDLEFKKISPVGDQALLLYFGSISSVYYINEVMSCYRLVSNGSWNESYRKASQKLKNDHCRRMIDTYRAFDLYTEGKFHASMQARIVYQLYKIGDYKKIRSKEFKKARKNWPFKIRLLIYLKANYPILMRMLKK